MKLLRFTRAGGPGGPELGVLVEGRVVPFSVSSGTFITMMDIIAGGPDALDQVRRTVSDTTESLAVDDVRLLAPIERPGKYLAIGMNYGSHREEARKLGFDAGTRQIWFNKQTSCICGPCDDIDPGPSAELDYEVELAAVIGLAAKKVDEKRAPAHIFGWMVANDVSARDWQRHSPTFTVGKSFDTHGPIGPWITTADEVPEPHALRLRCTVNGEVRQDSDTGKMIASVWSQIAYLSTAMTLEPGDILATGTPEGVGAALTPPRFLAAGDKVMCEIERLGRLTNTVIQPDARL